MPTLETRIPRAFTRETLEGIESLPGVVYITDPGGVILAYVREPWDAFAVANDAPHLCTPAAVLGHSVLDAIADEDNRIAYTGFMRVVAEGLRERIGFDYRCDAARVGRLHHMEMVPVRLAGGDVAVVYQNRLREEYQRGTVGLFERQVERSVPGPGPIVRICTFCQHLQMTLPNGEPAWVDQRDYYLQGGTDQVRLSHGCCPVCQKNVIDPQMSALRDRPS